MAKLTASEFDVLARALIARCIVEKIRPKNIPAVVDAMCRDWQTAAHPEYKKFYEWYMSDDYGGQYKKLIKKAEGAVRFFLTAC
jgi:hypothetical protein